MLIFQRNHTNDGSFLFGIDDKGNSALSLAACEKYADIVKLLLDQGACIDHQNDAGRSSLMEAALWGRIENVKCLLEHGANRHIRDCQGRQAAELAESSPRNEEERYLRSGGEARVYKEVALISNQARRVIVALLRQAEDHPYGNADSPDKNSDAHSFHKTDKRGLIELIATVAEFAVTNEWKTIATLQRPPHYQQIAAMSGWGHGQTKTTVSGRDWTDEGMRIASVVKYQLPRDTRRDGGTSDQFFASHAKKQDMQFLVKAEPPVLLRRATILVSLAPCDGCVQFMHAVNSAVGVAISILDRRVSKVDMAKSEAEDIFSTTTESTGHYFQKLL